MSTQAPDETNILALLRMSLFAGDADNTNLVKDLKKFQRYLVGHDQATISLPAISRWFQARSQGPSRPGALRFIHGYLLWALATKGETIDRPAVESLAGRLAEDGRASETEPGVGAARRRQQEFKRWKVGQDTVARLSALQATYQIIRPFVSKPGRYVLEAMAIEVHAERRQADLLMYSHNQPIDGFMYSGEILPSSRHCFAFVSRRDEIDTGRYTFRCMTLNVLHRKIANGYEPKYCMSGLMLRGVKGAGTVGNPSVCVPFIAIRATQSTLEFHQAKFVELGDKLNRLSAESCVLLGEIEEKDGGVFRFCHRVFSQLKPEFSLGMILRTVSPDLVESAIAPAARTKQEYYGAWAEVAKAAIERKPDA